MFTGLIEEIGTVLAFDRSSQTHRLVIELGALNRDLKHGASIAVEGCCLTVVAFDDRCATFELIPETLARTTFGTLQVGSKVNLERAVLPTTRLGGHFVQGHIDGQARVVKTVPGARWAEWHFEILNTEAMPFIVPKGSIAIDGISLTVAGCQNDARSFWVALIPETLKRTTLGTKDCGSKVNIETDILGRYVLSFLKSGQLMDVRLKLTEGWLKHQGY